MLKEIEATSSKQLEVIRKNVSVAITDDAQTPFYLTLPPVDELRAIRDLAELQVSVNEIASDASGKIQEHFASELNRLAQKSKKFGNSITYLNHLSNLAELAGDSALGERYLRSALTLSSERFLQHRLEENLLRQRKLSDLEAVLSSQENDVDYDAALYLAYSSVLQNEYDQALAYVSRALDLDPIDYRARMLSGALYLYRGEYAKAIQNFRIAAEEKANSSALFVNLAVAYFCLGDATKALTAARRAVLINPLDQNAVALYADITFHEYKSVEAIPYLEKFTRYEQKSPSLWSRLAQAYYLADRFNDALNALRHEAAIQESPAVWNNMGVIYSKKGDAKQALRFYSYAIRDEAYKTDESAQLALANLLLLLNEHERYAEIIKIASPIINSNLAAEIAKRKQPVGIFLAYLQALTRSGKADKALRFADNWLGSLDISTQLRLSLLTHLLSHFSLFDPNEELALRYSSWALQSLTKCTDCDPWIRSILINNIAFTFIEFGQLDSVSEVLPMLSKAVHQDPFSTATLGLYHLRKDHIQRGEALYKDAITLAADRRTKNLIRQKMNLELGRSYLKQGDIQIARKLLEKATQQGKHNIHNLQKQAQALLKTLKQ